MSGGASFKLGDLMPEATAFPLDLQRSGYSYVERHNSTLVGLLEEHVLRHRPEGRVLDVGCGAGANARALRARFPGVYIEGVEPNPTAAAAAKEVMDAVWCGTSEDWRKQVSSEPFDAIILSDVLEHMADPVAFLESLAAVPALRHSTWIISVPNYGVWYNRVKTLLGQFDYAWSGLYDRTHLRFFTKTSLRSLLGYVGFAVVGEGSTPSLVQSLAPVLRRAFDGDVARGEHLTLTKSPAYALYDRLVEPWESRLCGVWPSLLAFQIVVAVRLREAR